MTYSGRFLPFPIPTQTSLPYQAVLRRYTVWYSEAIASNPFITDRPLAPDELAGRGAEIQKLFELAEGGHNSLLLGPRRYGKTSLLRAVQAEAARQGWATVLVDFYGVVSLPEMAIRVEEAYRTGLQGPLKRWYAGVVRTWSPRFRLGVPGGGPEIEAGPTPEGDDQRLLTELLELPRGVMKSSGKRTLVIFDEFQSVLGADDKADALIRSVIQHHQDEASYVFAGSEPGLMAQLFSTRERPLFGQARPLRLTALGDDILAGYIGERFDRSGKDPGAGLEPLLFTVRGHPQRAMLTAYHLWDVTPAGSAATEEHWATALDATLAELQEVFENVWEALPSNERRTMTAVAWTGPWGQGRTLYAKDSLNRFKLSKSAVQFSSKNLVKKGELEDVDGVLRLVDPLLEAWIASGRRPRY